MRHNYELKNGILFYKLEVNNKLAEYANEEIDCYSENIESELVPLLSETLTEKLFFNRTKLWLNSL